MAHIFDPAIPLGERRPWVAGPEALAHRVRAVLETRPGGLPWRPDFGCDLDSLVGYPTTSDLVAEARWRVEAALRRWLPDVEIRDVAVSAVPVEGSGSSPTDRRVPIAEAALLTMGVQASLYVDIDLVGPDGPMTVSASLNP
jgi:phage baseplate assembly protein W